MYLSFVLLFTWNRLNMFWYQVKELRIFIFIIFLSILYYEKWCTTLSLFYFECFWWRLEWALSYFNTWSLADIIQKLSCCFRIIFARWQIDIGILKILIKPPLILSVWINEGWLFVFRNRHFQENKFIEFGLL